MADGRKLTACPVCSHGYQVEGEHIPCTLCCLCTVCEQCIRSRLREGTSVECPLCGTENDIENVRKNNSIISHINEMADKAHKKKDYLPEAEKECSKHAEEINLFCKECQTPVCISCLKDQHEGHDFSELEEATEELCSGLLEDVEWMKEILQKKKHDIAKVQQIVAENCQECTSEVIARKEYLINEINQIAGNLVRDITEQKNTVDIGINKSFAYIGEKLDLVKDFETIAKNKTVFEVETPKLVRFKNAKDEIQFRFSETTPYNVLTYMRSDDTTDCLSHLCGKLIEYVAKDPVTSPKTKLEKDDHKVMDQKISRDSSLQEEGALNISTTTAPAVTASTFGRDCSQEKTSAVSGSHRVNGTPVPVVKDTSIDQSDAAEKSEESALQPENTPDELVRRVNGILEKAGKLLPSTNTAAPDEDLGNSPYLQSEGGATEVQASVNSVVGIQSTNNVSGRNTALSGSWNLKDPRKCTSHLYDRRDDVQTVAEPVAGKARLEALPHDDSESIYPGPWRGTAQQYLGRRCLLRPYYSNLL